MTGSLGQAVVVRQVKETQGGNSSPTNPYGSGGGGGAGATGANATSGVSGAGGTGLAYSISGVSTYYSGGGGGGASAQGASAGAGGNGGGGAGGTAGAAGGNGTANIGGGGGGQKTGGGPGPGSGGSGIVIVRYLTPSTPIKFSNETTIKQEGTGSTKLTLGAPQIDGNTVALWHFEETGTTTGTTLYDETANNNDATTTGTTIVGGIFGKARKFNGTISDYVSVASSASLQTSPYVTLSAWINLSPSGSGTYRSVVGDQNDTGLTGTSIMVRDTGIAHFQVGDGAWHGVDGVSVLPTNQWVFIVGTYDGSTSKIYINGLLEGSFASAGTISHNNPFLYWLPNWVCGT